MKNLKIKYVFNIFLVILLLISICRFIYFNKSYKSYNTNRLLYGTVININKKENIEVLTIKGKRNFLAYTTNNSISVGDKILFTYNRREFNTFNIPNAFNYQDYLKGKGINEVIDINDIKKVGENKIHKIKGDFYNLVNKKKSKDYIYTFIFCDRSLLDQEVKDSFSNNGIIHLISVSGFHILFLLSLLKKFFSKIISSDIAIRVVLYIIILVYLFLSNYSAPLLRASLFYIFSDINRSINNAFSKNNIFILSFFISIILFPYYLYNSGFWYSYIMSYFLMINESKLSSMFKINLYAYIITLPLTIYFNYRFNLLSIIYAIIFFHVICYFIYPLSILALIFSSCDMLLYKITRLINNIVLRIDNIKIFTIIIGKISIYILVIVYILYYLYINNYKIKYIFLLIIIFIYSYFKVYLDRNTYVYFLDVGQGDSILITTKNYKSVTLIDTGGLIYGNGYLSRNLINFFDSISVRKIDNLIISHGDFDHMGEAINLVNNFKVEKVIFNCGPYNDLEKELIKVLVRKK